jgi:hypothetical protein
MARWINRLFYGVLTIGLSKAGVAAQESRPVAKSYFNKGIVQLPIQIDEQARAQVKEVQLCVKEGPHAPWHVEDKAPGTQSMFTFRTSKEGEYWFNLVIVDRAGRAVPGDVAKEAPGLVVVVDSTPPQIEAENVATVPEGQKIHCEILDANPDPSKTSFLYQTRDQNWWPLNPIAGQSDVFLIPIQAATTGMIRIVARDLAGNTTTRDFDVSNLPTAASMPSSRKSQGSVVLVEGIEEDLLPAPPLREITTPARKERIAMKEVVAPLPERIETIAIKSTETPPPEVARAASTRPAQTAKAPPAPISGPGLEAAIAPKVEPTIAPKAEARILPKVEPATTAKVEPIIAPTVEPATTPTVEPTTSSKVATSEAPANRHLINNTHIMLRYQIEHTGASGVGRVEIWCTRDLGKTWQKLDEDVNRKGQAEVDLPGEGVYGLTVVISNGRGFGANPPKAGDPADWWVEVDTTKPQAELLNVRSNPNGEDGSLHITWSAKDKNLHAEPIDLFFAPNRHGPWLPIATGVKNDGLYRWTPAADAGSHAFIRLTVHDKAGNSASCESIQPVPLDDLSRPRGRVVGIVTVPRPSPLPPMGN